LPTINLTNIKALVIPASLLIQNPALAISETFTGKALSFRPERGLDHPGTVKRSRLDSAKETARLIRLMAENQVIPTASVSSGITALLTFRRSVCHQILFSIIIMIVSAFFQSLKLTWFFLRRQETGITDIPAVIPGLQRSVFHRYWIRWEY
jgi:hypothetical protein